MTRSASPRRSASTSRSRCEAVEQPAAALQRVRAAGGLLAADQDVVGGLEEEQRRTPAGRALAPGWPAATRRTSPDRTSTTTAIGWSVPWLSSTSRTTSRSSVGRQVVDDVEAEVLELLGGGAAAGAGHAGDDDELAAVRAGWWSVISPPRSRRWRC